MSCRPSSASVVPLQAWIRQHGKQLASISLDLTPPCKYGQPDPPPCSFRSFVQCCCSFPACTSQACSQASTTGCGCLCAQHKLCRSLGPAMLSTCTAATTTGQQQPSCPCSRSFSCHAAPAAAAWPVASQSYPASPTWSWTLSSLHPQQGLLLLVPTLPVLSVLPAATLT